MILPNGQPLRYNTPGARWGGTVAEVMAALQSSTHTTMPSDNLISATLAAEAKTQILTKLDEIKALLPFLINLTPFSSFRLSCAFLHG